MVVWTALYTDYPVYSYSGRFGYAFHFISKFRMVDLMLCKFLLIHHGVNIMYVCIGSRLVRTCWKIRPGYPLISQSLSQSICLCLSVCLYLCLSLSVSASLSLSLSLSLSGSRVQDGVTTGHGLRMV